MSRAATVFGQAMGHGPATARRGTASRKAAAPIAAAVQMFESRGAAMRPWARVTR